MEEQKDERSPNPLKFVLCKLLYAVVYTTVNAVINYLQLNES